MGSAGSDIWTVRRNGGTRMTQFHMVQVRCPKDLVEKFDQWIAKEKAKSYGTMSRSSVVSKLIADLVEKEPTSE
jgi:metal-responsive CopG/Arc/MetJ family transcriptional regulator